MLQPSLPPFPGRRKRLGHSGWKQVGLRGDQGQQFAQTGFACRGQQRERAISAAFMHRARRVASAERNDAVHCCIPHRSSAKCRSGASTHATGFRHRRSDLSATTFLTSGATIYFCRNRASCILSSRGELFGSSPAATSVMVYRMTRLTPRRRRRCRFCPRPPRCPYRAQPWVSVLLR